MIIRDGTAKSTLPVLLERKLFRAAALLESVDEALAEVTKAAEEYKLMINRNEAPVIGDAITKIGVLALLEKFLTEQRLLGKISSLEEVAPSGSIVNELSLFGIENLGEVNRLLNSIERQVFVDYLSMSSDPKPIKIFRVAMCFSEPLRYFEVMGREKVVKSIGAHVLDLLQKKFPEIKIAELVKSSGIKISR